jgi:hypothetical protein
VTDESEQQYPVSEGRCVQRDFGLPQRCFRYSKMLRLSTDNDVKYFYAGLLTLRVQALRSFEMSVNMYQLTRRPYIMLCLFKLPLLY